VYACDFVVISDTEMEGSCALRQGNAACGLTGSDADTLNVEHDLSRWLRDLDTSVSRSSDCRLSVSIILYRVFYITL